MSSGFGKFLVFLSILGFFVVACASQEDVIYLDRQLTALKQQSEKDAERVQKSIKGLQEAFKANETKYREIERVLKEDQKSLRSSLGKFSADLDGMKEDIQELTGRTEESGHLLRRVIEEDTGKDALVSRLKEFSLMVNALKPRLERIENYLGSEIRIDTKKPPVETEGLPSEVRQKERLTESEIYDTALAYYKDGHYQDAIAALENFFTLHPKSDLADNAQFWIGESYRSLKRYKEAVLAYQRAIEGYPQGNKVPIAMLHQAFAFEQMNDKTSASLVFKKLLKSFPNTKEAEIASKRLKEK